MPYFTSTLNFLLMIVLPIILGVGFECKLLSCGSTRWVYKVWWGLPNKRMKPTRIDSLLLVLVLQRFGSRVVLLRNPRAAYARSG